jgi:cell division protein FtsW
MIIIFLCAIGTTMVMSASSVESLNNGSGAFSFVTEHVINLTIGAVLFLVISRFDYRAWLKLGPIVLGVAVLMLILVLIPGIGIVRNEARRWLGVAPFVFQPSELVKFPLAIVLAGILAAREKAGELRSIRRTLLPVGGITALISVLILKQPDFDSTLVILGLVAGMLLLVGIPKTWLLGAAVGGAALTYYQLSEPFRRARVFVFLDPWKDPLGAGYQSIAGYTSLALGGWFGTGPGTSTAKWGFLPVAYSDFVFAVIGEEFGVAGCLAVVIGFIAFGVTGFKIALCAPDRFGTLLASGLTLTVLIQAAINIGMVVGIVPVSGLTLPFISYGGTSLILMLSAAGILCNIAYQGKPRVASTKATPRAKSSRG